MDNLMHSTNIYLNGVLLVDLGSGYASKLDHPGLCIAELSRRWTRQPKEGRLTCLSHTDAGRHLNPHLFGFTARRR